MEHSTWAWAGSSGLPMSKFEKDTLREIWFILYKVEYLCTVNKYITNLSCLKKVLPFRCLFSKLKLIIYKKVLPLFFLSFFCFLFCFFLLSSMHIVAFGLKIQLWKKNKNWASSLLSHLNVDSSIHRHWSGWQLSLLVLDGKVGL